MVNRRAHNWGSTVFRTICLEQWAYLCRLIVDWKSQWIFGFQIQGKYVPYSLSVCVCVIIVERLYRAASQLNQVALCADNNDNNKMTLKTLKNNNMLTLSTFTHWPTDLFFWNSIPSIRSFFHSFILCDRQCIKMPYLLQYSLGRCVSDLFTEL